MTSEYESSTGSCSWGDVAAPYQFRCSIRSNHSLPSSASTSTGASSVVGSTFRSASIRCKARRRLHMDPSDRSDKHTWTAQEYAAFIDICWKLTRDGFRTKACLDDEGYRRLGEEFLQRIGVALRKSQFHHKWDNTKRDWKVYKKLRTLSGTGRDPVTGVVTVPNAWPRRSTKSSRTLDCHMRSSWTSSSVVLVQHVHGGSRVARELPQSTSNPTVRVSQNYLL